MERRNSRAQSCPRESEKKGEQKSLLASFKDAFIDAVTPSWISMRSPTPGTSHDADDVATSDSGHSLSSSSPHVRRLSQSQPALYENGQPRTLDFSPPGTSQGIPVQSGSRDFMQPVPARSSPSQDYAQLGVSQSFMGQGYAQTGSSTSPDITQPQTSSSQGIPVNPGFSQHSVSADSRNRAYNQPGTPLGLGRTPKRQDYAQPGPSHGTPFPPPAFVPPVSEFTSSQLPLNRLVDKSDSVMAQDDTVSQRSHSSHSTSGCSSMAPQGNHGNREPSRDPAKRRRESGENSIGTQTPPPQPEAKRPRLNVNISSVTHNHNTTNYRENVTWTELHRRRMDDTPIRDRQPHFKPHLLGSPLGSLQTNPARDEGSPFSQRARSEDGRPMSDYYPGPTTYMGRYNYRDEESQSMIDRLPRPGQIRSRSEQRGSRRGSNIADRSKSQWPYPVKVIPRPRVKPLHPEQQGEPVISETARKIMEALDGMKTPMSDAKKIPVIVPDYWPTTRFSQERPRNSGPPTRGLQVGGLANVVPNRQVYGRTSQPGPSGRQSPQPGPSGLQSNRHQQAVGNQASPAGREPTSLLDARHQASGLQDANNQALQFPSTAQIRRAYGARENDDERHAAEDRQVLRARRRLPEPASLRSAPTLPVGGNAPFNLPPVDFTLMTSPSGHHMQFNFTSPNQPSPSSSGAFQFSQPIHLEEAAGQPAKSRTVGTTTQPTTAGFSFSSPIKQGSPGVVSETNTSKALTQGSICSTGMNFTDKSPSLKDMLNSSSGAGFSFKPADSIKHDSILDKLDKSGSKFSKPYQKPNKNSATDKLVNSDAGSGFRPAEKLKQGSVMDMLGGSGFKPAEKLKSGSVMDVLGNNSNAGYSFKPADQLKQGSVMDILGSSGSGFKPASELKQGSVMDILGGKTSQETSTTDLQKATRPQTGSAATSTTGLGAITKETSTSTTDLTRGTQSAATSKTSLVEQSEPAKTESLASLFKTASGTWECGVCLIQNKPETTQCVACQTPKPGGKGPGKSDSKDTATGSSKSSTTSISFSETSVSEPASNSNSQNLGSMFKPPTGTWSCSVCLIQNKPDVTQCAACQSPKPETKTEPASQSSSQDLSSMFKPPTGTWSCLVCMVQNKPDTTQCAACQTPKPEKKTATKMPSTETPSGWTCEICLVPNKGSDTVCVACQSEKPAKPYEHPPGDWECDTCNFTNKEGAIRCCNCEYIRPGPPRTQCVPSCVKTFLDARNSERFGESSTLSNSPGSKFGTTVSSGTARAVTSSGFKFGGGSGSTSTSVPGGFKFGNTVTNSESKPLGSGFKFGNTSTTSSSEPQSLGIGFKFGSPVIGEKTPSTSVSLGASSVSVTVASTGTGFQFGGTADSKQTESAFKTSTTSSDTQPKGFQIQFGNTSTSAISSSGLSFGSPSVTASAKVSSSQTTASSASSIQSSATSSPLTFNFGSGTMKDHKLPTSSATKTGSQTGFPVSSIGGFNFSANKTNTVTVTSVQSTVCSTAPIGMFAFSTKPSTGVTGPSTTASDKPKPAEATPAPTGGFNFTPAQTTPAAPSVFGSFNTAQKPAEATTPQQPKLAENAAPGFSAGGFTFNAGTTETGKPSPFGAFNSTPNVAAKPAENAAPGFGGFNFKPAQTEAPKITGFGFPAAQGQSTSFGQPSSAKRSVEDDSSAETSAKKAPVFNFGASSNTNTSFQMPGSSNDTNSDWHGSNSQHDKPMSQRFSWKVVITRSSPTGSMWTASRSSAPSGSTQTSSRSSAPADSTQTSSRSSAPTGSTQTSSRSSALAGYTRMSSRSSAPTGSAQTSSRSSALAGSTQTSSRSSAPAGSTQTSSRSSAPTGFTQMSSRSSAPAGSTQTSSRTSALATAAELPSVLAGTGNVFVFGRQNQSAGSAQSSTGPLGPSTSAGTGPTTLQNLGDLMKFGTQVSPKPSQPADTIAGKGQSSSGHSVTKGSPATLQNLGELKRFWTQDSPQQQLIHDGSYAGTGRNTPESQPSAMEAEQSIQHANLSGFSFGTWNIQGPGEVAINASQAQQQALQAAAQNLMPSLGDLMKFGAQSIPKTPPASQPTSTQSGFQPSPCVFVFGGSRQTSEKAKQSKPKSPPPSNTAVNFVPDLGDLMKPVSQSSSNTPATSFAPLAAQNNENSQQSTPLLVFESMNNLAETQNNLKTRATTSDPPTVQSNQQSAPLFIFDSAQNNLTAPARSIAAPSTQTSQQSTPLFVFGSMSKPAESSGKSDSKLPPQSVTANLKNLWDLMRFGTMDTQASASIRFTSSGPSGLEGPQTSKGPTFSTDNTIPMTAGQSSSGQGFRLAYGFFPEAMEADFEKSNSSFGSMHASFYDEADLRDYDHMSDSSRSSSSSSVSRKSSKSQHRSRGHSDSSRRCKKSSGRITRASRHSSASSRSGSRSQSRSPSRYTRWWSKSRRTSKSSVNSRSSSSGHSRCSSVSSRKSSRSSSRGQSKSRRRSRSGSSKSSRRSSRGRSKTAYSRGTLKSHSSHRSGSADSKTSGGRSKAKDDKIADATALNLDNPPGSSGTKKTDKNDNEGTSKIMNLFSLKKPLTASVFGGTKDFTQDAESGAAHLSRAGTGSFGCFDLLSMSRTDTGTTRRVLAPSAFDRAKTDTPGTSISAVLTNSSAPATTNSDILHNLMPSLGELMKNGLMSGPQKEPPGPNDVGTVNTPASQTPVIMPPTTNNVSPQNLLPSLGELMKSGLQSGHQKEAPGPNVGTVNIPASETPVITPTSPQNLMPSLADLMKSGVQNTTQPKTDKISTTEPLVTSASRTQNLMPSLGDLIKDGLSGVNQPNNSGTVNISGSWIPASNVVTQGPTQLTSGATVNAGTVNMWAFQIPTTANVTSQGPMQPASSGILNAGTGNIPALQTPAVNNVPLGQAPPTSNGIVNTGAVNIQVSQTPSVNASPQWTTEAPLAAPLNAGTVNIPASLIQPSLSIGDQGITLSTPQMMNVGLNIPPAPTPPATDIGPSRILQAPPPPLQVTNVGLNISPVTPATNIGQIGMQQTLHQSVNSVPPASLPLVVNNIPPAPPQPGMNASVNSLNIPSTPVMNVGVSNTSQGSAPAVDVGSAIPPMPLQPVLNFGFAIPQVQPQPPPSPVVNGLNSMHDAVNHIALAAAPPPPFIATQNNVLAPPALPFSNYMPTSQKSRMECGSPTPSTSRMSCISQSSPRKMAMSPQPSPPPALMVMSPQASPRKMTVSPQLSPGKMTMSPQPGSSNMDIQVQNIPVLITPVNRGMPSASIHLQPQGLNVGSQNIILTQQQYMNCAAFALQRHQTAQVIPLPAPPIRLPAPPPRTTVAIPLPQLQPAGVVNAGSQNYPPQASNLNFTANQSADASFRAQPPTCVHFGAQSSYCGTVESSGSVLRATSSGNLHTSSAFKVTVDRNAAACGQNFAQSGTQPSLDSALKSPCGQRKPGGVRFNPSATKVEYPACDYSQLEPSCPITPSQSSGYASDSSMADALAEIAAEPEEEALNPNGHFAKFFRREMERKKRERDRGKRGMKGPKKTKRRRSPPPPGLPSPPRSPSPENWRSTSPPAISKRMCMKSGTSRRIYGFGSQSSSRPAQQPSSSSNGSHNNFTVPKSAATGIPSQPPNLDSIRNSNKSSPPGRSKPPSPEPSTSTGGSTGRTGIKRRTWKTNSKETVVSSASVSVLSSKPSVIRISRGISFQDENPPPRPPTSPEAKKRAAVKDDERADSREPPKKRPSLTQFTSESKKPVIKLSPLKKKSPPPRPPTPEALKRKVASAGETSDTATQRRRKIPEPDPSTVAKSKTPSPPLVKKKSSVHAFIDQMREDRLEKEKHNKKNKKESGSTSASSSSGSSHSSESSESVSVLQAWARLRIASASAVNMSASAANSASNSASDSASSSSVTTSPAASNTNQSANTGGFAFGAQATSTPAAPFVFGAQQPTQAPTPAAPAPAVPQSFNFSATPNLNFTATAAPGPASFAFSAAPASSDSSKRVVKKAVRRLKR